MSDEVQQLREEISELTERVDEIERRMNQEGEQTYTGDLREFVESFQPDSHTERSLAIAYYIEQFRGQENFTVDAIKDGYRECRVKSPANMSDVLGGMEENEWLLRDGKEERKQLWRLTATAQEEVEERIKDNG